MRVRLTKRFAAIINGVDLSRVHEGDVIDVSPRDAGILVTEGWALPVENDAPDTQKTVKKPGAEERTEAADRPSKTRTRSR